MSYEFVYGESVPDGIVRIVTEEIDEALEALRGGGDRVKAVHTSRKSIKKLRAVLRLFEKEMGRKAFAPENRFLRDAGRTLSDTRDADVLIESFDGIAERLTEKGTKPKLIAKARETVFGQRAIAQHDGTPAVEDGKPKDAIAEAIGRLEEAKERVQQWPISGADRSTIIKGMRDIYRAGRLAMKEAYNQSDEQDDELFHDWRKRVKDLWYHTLLLQPTWPKLLDTYAEQAHKLADYLGDEHDLSILATVLEQHRAGLGEATFDSFMAEIAGRRENLKSKAHWLGEQIYAEKPTAYQARIEKYWQVWKG